MTPAADPLLLALTAPSADIETAVTRGEAEAQFAKAIILAHGLRGQPQDSARANTLRSQALSQRPGTTLTQYIPGINGQPGRVVPLVAQGAVGFSPVLAQKLDACIQTLSQFGSDAMTFDPRSWGDTDNGFERMEAENARRAETCGGSERYGHIAALWTWERPWRPWPLPNCETEDTRCHILSAKIQRLNGRDPRREAIDAAARGDFRLGATNHIGPMPQGWDTTGVTCRAWTRDMVGKWHVNQDVIRPGDPQHTAASASFIATYNRTLIQQPGFPFKDICGPDGGQPAQRHTGAIGSYADAARTKDTARLADVPASADINVKDVFGVTALSWATRNRDEPMAKALMEAGADPNTFDLNEPGPLAVALNADQFELAQVMLSRGAKLQGPTGRCERFGLFSGPPEGNNGCSWAGLLILKKRFDLLDELAAGPEGQTLLASGAYELDEAFLAAVRSNDRITIQRLSPHAGQNHRASITLKALDALGDRDVLMEYVAANGAETARSPAEAELWRIAARVRQAGPLDVLRTRGGDLNLLSPARLQTCGVAIRQGDGSLLELCIDEAIQRKQAIEAAVMAGDDAAFQNLLADVSDVRERNKPPLLGLVVQHGSVPMLEQILARGFDFQQPWMGESALILAARRGERERVRLLADAGARGLVQTIGMLGNLGNPPPGLQTIAFGSRNEDTERLPNNNGADNLEAIRIVAAEAARIEGPQALEASFKSAAYSGYNDVLEILLANGLDLRSARQPGEIWYAWAGLGQPCKPSTGRILLKAGLPTTYPASNFTRDTALHIVASRCMNPRSIDLLVSEGGMAVNILNIDGETPLDRATTYREEYLIAALKALGGRTAAELDPAAYAQRQNEERVSDDLDLEQSERN
ncbi:ankyrin repeat domain-containing protein [Brevundimonas faecalis]|uniref:ankyrin repeat domain-containing protein n=1 Tax=Brevundimonas faecalis TaxID=947378 RepID=UPI0033917A7A